MQRHEIDNLTFRLVGNMVELLQGLQAADMFLSAKKIFILFLNPLRFVDVIPPGFLF